MIDNQNLVNNIDLDSLYELNKGIKSNYNNGKLTESRYNKIIKNITDILIYNKLIKIKIKREEYIFLAFSNMNHINNTGEINKHFKKLIITNK